MFSMPDNRKLEPSAWADLRQVILMSSLDLLTVAAPGVGVVAVVSSDAFGRYVAEIWHDLREEASRGIRDDESRVLEGRTKR